jgi:beta-glucosidase-like glycosyl hydrolase
MDRTEPAGQSLKLAQELERIVMTVQEESELTNIQAALFPCGVSLAATWDTKLLYEVGQHLAEECKARSAHVLLAPTVCLHRGPLGGRNFESFSEDPLLTGKLAASYINGLQQRGISATIKRMYLLSLTSHHVK